MLNNKKHLKSTIYVCIIITILFSIGTLFILHEKRQNEKIQSLEENISKLNYEIEAASADDINWLDNGFNYLAIGNSITLHGQASYWWNDVGMAASNAEHDYFHIVSSYLKQENTEFMGQAYNFAVWETQSHDRDETLPYLDHYLSPKLDLVTIQLGENAADLITYEDDYKSLITYVKEKAPNAKILVIGDFWIKDNRNDLKINAAKATDIDFVSLDGIADNSDYYCGMGTIVFGEDGKEHIVEHNGVANHPGDKGMKAIAERIISFLQ